MKQKAPKVLEKDITRSIRDFLKVAGVFHWKVWQGLGSTPGVSDIIGLYKGIPLFLEIKTNNGRLSDKQKEFLRKVNDNGGLGVVLKSVDDAIKLFDGLSRGENLSSLRERF